MRSCGRTYPRGAGVLVSAVPIIQDRPLRRIAIINQKGGVGKTTTAASLGAAAAALGQRVLLVDLDPQGHLSLHFGCELAQDDPSVYDVLTSSRPIGEVAVRPRPGVTLVPANIDLAAAETELVSVPGREMILKLAVDGLADGHDLLLIDCPPSLGVLTINALVAAEEVVIPLQSHFLALQGLGKLLETVTLVRQRINPRLRVAGVVLCMHEPSTKLAAEVVDDLAGFLEKARGTDSVCAGAVLYRTFIRRNIKLAESAGYGQTILDYAPKSNGAEDYLSLAAEVFGAAARAGVTGEAVAAGENGRVVHGAGATGSNGALVPSTLPPAASLEGRGVEVARAARGAAAG